MTVTSPTGAPSSHDAPLAAGTVGEAFGRTVRRHPDRAALRTLDGSVSFTWSELDARVRAVAAGFAGLGVAHGDTVAFLMANRPELHVADFALVHLGAVPFGIFTSSSAEQIAQQVGTAGARVIVTESALLATVTEAVPDVEIVVVDGAEGRRDLDDVVAAGPAGFDLDARAAAVTPDDLVTMIYTSGTTGPPKGAQWSHRTVMSQQRALDAALPLPTDDIVSFLPMAHAGGRITSHYMALPYGATITTCADMRDLPAHVARTRPDAFFSVPRLWEKFQVAVEGMIDAEGLRAELETNLRKVRADDAGTDVPAAEAESLTAEAEANLERFRPLVATLGLDNIKAAFVGGAPCAPEVVQFFRAVGVPLLAAYGATECSLNIFNRVDDFKSGTAGKPLPGVEVRLADDGELLCRAELNMVGYRDQPEETARTLDKDGWLHTGDIAAIDDDGYVTIVDRKKELIISSAGKNMSPANIESAIKGESSLIGQIVAIGDGRKYNTALIVLDPEAAPQYAKRCGLPDADLATLAAGDELRAEIDGAVERGNARLNNSERIKKYRLLPGPWLPDSDELTPTAKVKRRSVAEKYAAEIEDLYAE